MIGISREWAGWRLAKILLVAIPTLALFSLLYFWRLGNLVPGLSAHEAAERTSASSLTNIENNPIDAPHKILQFIFQNFGHHGAFWMRSVSVFFAILFLVALFLLIRAWFGNLMGIVGTLLVVATPWIAILARSAASDIMFFSPILVLSSFVFFTKAEDWYTPAWFALIISTAIAIYTPGIIWFILLGLIFARRSFLETLSDLSGFIIVTGLALFLILISPLAYGIYLHPNIAKDLLLIPHTFPSGTEIAKSFAWSGAALVVKARHHIDYIVGTMAILNIAQGALGLVGFYAMIKSAKYEAYLLAIWILGGLVLAAINENAVILTLCLPAIVVFDAAAMHFLYVKWFKVFPLNPLPRVFAVILITFFIFSHAAYGLRYTLSAWPHSHDTLKIYMLK
jgi:hypothetical protein